MTAWPFEHRLQIGGVLYLLCCLVMEWRIVDDADGFARHLVAQREEMREIILAESGVVFLEAADAPLLL